MEWPFRVIMPCPAPQKLHTTTHPTAVSRMKQSGSFKAGIRRIILAFGYSLKGFQQSYQFEAAFRQEVWLSLILVPLGLYLGNSGIERALLVFSWMLVPVIELVNSAIEATVDRISDEQHPLAGRAKDAGSAAVFLSISLAAVVWLLILFPT